MNANLASAVDRATAAIDILAKSIANLSATNKSLADQLAAATAGDDTAAASLNAAVDAATGTPPAAIPVP